jgi:hypothetical protein
LGCSTAAAVVTCWAVNQQRLLLLLEQRQLDLLLLRLLQLLGTAKGQQGEA